MTDPFLCFLGLLINAAIGVAQSYQCSVALPFRAHTRIPHIHWECIHGLEMYILLDD